VFQSLVIFYSLQILASALLTANLWMNVKAGLHPVGGGLGSGNYVYFTGPLSLPAQPVVVKAAGVGGSVTSFGGAVPRSNGITVAALGVGTHGGHADDYAVSKIFRTE
jgi:hypothetical protein